MTIPNYQAIGTGDENTCVWPTHTTGDFGVLCIEHSNIVVQIPAPTGFTAFPGMPVNFTAGGTALAMFYRFATSSSEANVSLGGTVNHRWGTIITYRNVSTATPFHGMTTAYFSPSATLVALPGITTLLDDCMILNVLAWANDDAGPLGSAPTNAALGSVTERYDAGTTTAGGGGLYLFDGTLASHGTFGPSTVTMSSAALAALAVVALCPADKTLPTLGRKSRIVNMGGM